MKNDGDRQILEMICNEFVQLRPKLGRNQPKPMKVRKAWDEVADKAANLEDAIDELRAAGAADFALLDACPVNEAEAKWSAWLLQLRLLKDAAAWAADEMVGIRSVQRNEDPMRDDFVEQLVNIWKEHGRPKSHSGPLVAFLSAVTEPALRAVGESAMTEETIEHCVRRVRKRSKGGEPA